MVSPAIFAPLITHDSAQPRSEITGDVESADGLPGGNKGVLNELACPVMVTRQNPRIGEERLVVVADQFGKLGAVHDEW